MNVYLFYAIIVVEQDIILYTAHMQDLPPLIPYSLAILK